MPGLYLAAILVSAAGIAALDARFRLAFWAEPVRTAVAVAVGTAFFLIWDAAGIITGVFRQGEGAALLGISLAPHLPLEEPFFLAFLSYLAVVCHQAGMRWIGRRRMERKGARG